MTFKEKMETALFGAAIVVGMPAAIVVGKVVAG